MDRSLFPAGVEVGQADLRYQGDSLVFHTLARFTAMGVMGIRTGLTPSVNATDPSRFDLSAGDGFAANGELIEVEVALVGQSLASTTPGARTYVVAFYEETTGHPGQPETGGAARDRRAMRSSRLAVMTEAGFQSLPPAATDAASGAGSVERAMIVCVVTAPASSGGALTAASFAQAVAYRRILTTSQPVNITGVQINYVEPTLALSEGLTTNPSARLELDYGTVGTDYRVRLRPPGSTTFGDWVTVTAGGNYTVYSLTGSTGPYMRIAVTTAMLPLLAATASVADDLPVSALYEAAYGANRLSANDAAHRSATGAGLPTAVNPHGLTFADLSGDGVLRTLVVGRGLLDTAAQGVVPRILFEGQSTGAYTLEQESRIGASAVRRRLYREHATGGLVETVNAYWSPVTTNWNKDVLGTSAMMRRQTPSAIETLGRADADDTPWTSWRTDASLGSISTISRLNVQSTVAALATTLPRHNAPYPVTGAGDRVLIRQSGPSDGTIQGGTVREYRTTVTTGGGNPAGTLEITINASWNGSTWQRDQAVPSYKFEYGRTSLIAVYSRTTNSVAWADNNWETTQMVLDAATGALAAGDFSYITPPTRTQVYTAWDFRADDPAIAGVAYAGQEFPGNPTPQPATYVTFTAGANIKALYASLKEVPNGATVSAITLRGTFATVSGDYVLGALVRTDRSTNVTQAWNSVTEAWEGYADTYRTDQAIAAGTNVDRELLQAGAALTLDWLTYNYWIYVGGYDPTSASSATMTLVAALVEYTTPGPQ